jgi:hypothetical protein
MQAIIAGNLTMLIKSSPIASFLGFNINYKVIQNLYNQPISYFRQSVV